MRISPRRPPDRKSLSESLVFGFVSTSTFDAGERDSCSNARMSISAGGGSMKSKWSRSWIPRDLSMSTTEFMLDRWISGTVFSSSSCLYAQFV